MKDGISNGELFGIVFVLAGLAFKISAVPFHMWTPDVYEGAPTPVAAFFATAPRSEEHTSELQSLMRISYAVFCLKTKTETITDTIPTHSAAPEYDVRSMVEDI